MSAPETSSGVSGSTPAGGCFLCAYADHRCTVPRLDGTLRGVVERWRGGRAPALLLAGTDGEPIAIVLDERERELARALAALPAEQMRKLRLRAYHLHGSLTRTAAAEPTADGASERYPTLRASPASAVVLEPDALLNITDINHAEYCVRQYALRRMVPSPPTAATLRGTILHGAFKELLKGRSEGPHQLLEQALRVHTTDLAIHRFSADAVAADAEPHLTALTTWYARQRQALWSSTPQIRVETFVLAPDVGLKGRLDALWEDAHTSQLLELKTSTVRGELPRREHRWQVHGYQTLLASRRQADPNRTRAATLLYSGTPGQAEAHTLKFTLRELHRVLELRNLLAIVHATGAVPPPPGERKCGRCAVRAHCLRASPLLGWKPPPSDEQPEPVDPRDAAWFRRYYALLCAEGRAAEDQARVLWTQPRADRCAAGIAIEGLEPIGEPQLTESGEWQYTLRCDNRSELREGDPVLVSDGDPIHGATVTGTILSISDREVVVWTPEPITHPALIDRYGSDIVHDRTVRNLWRWLEVEPRLRALARGERAPAFDAAIADRMVAGLNPEQETAVARALAARDFLLIQGPPGTGKTKVVAEIVRQLVLRGERVLVAAFTNQAVDNVLARLVQDGFTDFVRLGHELSVAPDLRQYRLGAQATAREGEHISESAAHSESAAVRAVLVGAAVVASTTATWSSERFDEGGQALRFDVAVVDEASQITVPALLGALRFAARFVLVGDERQLPPLVMSAEAAEQGLQESLFAALQQRWGGAATVALTRQYRMHPTICEFPSQAFYSEALVTDGTAATQRLALDVAPADGLEAVLDPAHPLVFIDVPETEGGAVGSGKASGEQARVVQRLVLGLRARGLDTDRIGIIAPYRAQVAAIRQRLAACGASAVTVDTVDRFQGGEREVILLSLVRGGPAVAGSEAGAFVSDSHRLNVALTRAQRKLIVLGDRRELEREPLLAQLIGYCAQLYGGRGGVVRAQRERGEIASGTP
jgi:DNA replication ATP-dependent helicase Dna2